MNAPGALRIACALLVVLGLAACGGGSGSAPSASSAGTTQSGTAAETTTPAKGPAPDWPAPPNAMELTKQAGLEPERHESLQFHVHAHLDVFFNGQSITVPAGIGINISDPGVQTGEFLGAPAYGGIRQCGQPCISPLHTHDVTGVLHTESFDPTPNRLGEFFTEWGVRLDQNCVGDYCKPDVNVQVYVDGELYDGNPAAIELTDKKEFAVVIGTPPAEIPAVFDFSGKV